MAPTKAEDDDPVTAEYDVYLTPPSADEVFLLQYPNRTRTRPYNVRLGAPPEDMRIKPVSGHLEVDVRLNIDMNFNKYQSLKWGDALKTAQDLHNKSGTFGAAAGFHGPKPRGVTARTVLKDQGDRELEVEQELMHFYEAEKQGKAMNKQVLGGQIARHDQEEAGKPLYFVGAFRGDQLHLTKVDGTVQMRPQFHHLDAEDERARLAASRAALDGDAAGAAAGARSLLQRAKTENEAEKGRLEDRMRRLLHAAEAEEWTSLEYVDEEDDAAFEKFRERMFVHDTDGVAKLKSSMDADQYLDAIGAPRRESPNRSRRRQSRRKRSAVDGGEIDEAEAEEDDDAVMADGP